MAKDKGIGKFIPVNPMEVLSAIGFAEEKSSAEFKLSLLVDRTLDSDLLVFAREKFRPQADNLILSVFPYYDEHCKLPPGSELVIILANESPITGRLLIQALKERIPAVVLTLDPLQLQRIARDNYNEIDLLSIVTVSGKGNRQHQFEQLFEELGLWVSRELRDALLPLARALPFVRDPFVKNAIQATSLQNAAIGAVFFLPGSDMPLLTLNQVKLFLQIAAVYGAELSKQRLKELIFILGGGLGFRTLARRLIHLVPAVGWAVRGSVAYSGTFAIGLATQKYFEYGGDLKSILKSSEKSMVSKSVT